LTVLQVGADEAGRGPVMGPMVLCALAADVSALLSLGVKDSKQLSVERRSSLFDAMKKFADWRISVVWPDQIDKAVAESSLNELELEQFAFLLRQFNADEFYVDAPDVDAARFASQISRLCGRKIIAEHKADQKYPSVSAASIIAKVTRDRLIGEISSELGCDIGSGYASDSRTIDFISHYAAANGDLPPYCRKSWATSKRIISGVRIKRLDEFR
jgi:ribonuclease HII